MTHEGQKAQSPLVSEVDEHLLGEEREGGSEAGKKRDEKQNDATVRTSLLTSSLLDSAEDLAHMFLTMTTPAREDAEK